MFFCAFCLARSSLFENMIGSRGVQQQKQAIAAVHSNHSTRRLNVAFRVSRQTQAPSHAAQSVAAAVEQQNERAPHQRDAAAAAAQPSRRQLLRSIPAAAVAAALVLTQAPASSAAEDAGLGALEKQLPGLPAPGPELPKTYQRTMHRLVKALRDTIETEAAGAKEFEVRRKADGAKDLVKEFVGKWQDNGDVAGDLTHTEMKDAISELGRFYQAKGPRARLDTSTRDSILAHLAAVEAGLPEEEKSLLGF